MPTVTSADGTAIDYEVTGSGPAVVLICAGPVDRSSNADIAQLLSRSCTVHNYDRRGRGARGDTAPHSLEREVEDLQAVIGAAGGDAGVFGNSGGVFIALPAFTAGTPITRIALWEPPFARPGIPANYAEQMHLLAQQGQAGEMAKWFLTAAVGMPEFVVAAMEQGPFWGNLASASNPALAYDATIAGDFAVPVGELAKVDCPLLVVDGATTPWISAAADAVAAAAPDCERRTLAGQQHNVEAAVLAPLLAGFFGS